MKKGFDNPESNQQNSVSNIKGQTIKDYEAIPSALKAAELEPNNAELQYKLASAHLKTGDSPSAIESALKAVNLNPNHVIYRAKLAEAYLVLGKYEEAKTHWGGGSTI